MTSINTIPVIWGIPENANTIPIILPDDCVKVRVRFRNDDFAKCWIKTSYGIRQFYLKWTDGKMEPYLEQGSNYRK